ncbi:MAG: ABC transporter ATP-binding protein [Gammaproteobacteria bacterium]|nr:ABC transporter ATP-binding protein [Gammaproteobacteria bacterium]
MRALRLESVHKQFANGVEALTTLDLTIGAGRFVALLGPSGCGKTTILRLVAGLETASSGRVVIEAGDSTPDGNPRMTRSRCATPSISYVFQEPTLMPWANVEQNIWLPLRILGVSRREARRRMAPVLESVGLAGFEQALPHELSGGMRMRASIARALITEPDIMLMDEPFAALDEITRQRLDADLLELWRARAFTVLFVTHNVYEAAFLAERILVMSPRPGRILADIEVDCPGPRTRQWRSSTGFMEICQAASLALASGFDSPPAELAHSS